MQEFNFQITDELNLYEHFNSEAVLIYFLDGSCELSMGAQRWNLEIDELIYIPAFRKHQWNYSGKILVAVLTFEISETEQDDGLYRRFICCNSVSGDGRSYVKLKKLFKDMIYEYIAHGTATSLRKKGLFYLLADELCEDFTQPFSDVAPEESETMINERMLTYIHKHFSENLTLEDVGKFVYMSPSVFSRYFKKITGVTFAHYVAMLRIDYACEQLRSTERKIIDIALDSGFAAASAFNKFFKKYKGMSPLEYRHSIKITQPQKDFIKKRQYSEIFQRFLEAEAAPEEGVVKKKVEANVSVVRAYKKVWNQALNVGAAAELLSGEQQKHVLLLKKLLGFQYIRIMNIFSSELHIRQGKDLGQANFDLLDNVLDFLVTSGLDVILDMGNKKKAILKTDQIKIYELIENRTFENLEDARQFIDNFLSHILMRYGEDCVSRWLYDISYEESEYSERSNYTFLTYSQLVLKLIKEKIPRAKVSVCVDILGKDAFEWLRAWGNHSVLPDFISISVLPYRPKIMEGGHTVAKRSMDRDFLKNLTGKARKMLNALGMENTGIIATEWNLNLSDRNCVNDSQEYAAQLLEMINDLLEDVDLAVYTFASDLNLRYFESFQPFFGGKGLLSKDGLFKPSAYALSLYSRLYEYLVQKDPGYIITQNGRGSYMILCYNAKIFHPNYYRMNESDMRMEMMDRIFSDEDHLEISFALSGFTNGDYIEKTYTLDKNNSILFQWEILGKKDTLDKEELDYLNKICIPRMASKTYRVTGGEYIRFVDLAPHEICLIQLSPVAKKY